AFGGSQIGYGITVFALALGSLGKPFRIIGPERVFSLQPFTTFLLGLWPGLLDQLHPFVEASSGFGRKILNRFPNHFDRGMNAIDRLAFAGRYAGHKHLLSVASICFSLPDAG